MLTAGIDVGSTACKVVVLGDGEVLSTVIGPSTASPAATAEASYVDALARAGVARADVRRVVGTGYGRARVAFADRERCGEDPHFSRRRGFQTGCLMVARTSSSQRPAFR